MVNINNNPDMNRIKKNKNSNIKYTTTNNFYYTFYNLLISFKEMFPS